MKNIILTLLATSSLALGAANDSIQSQRNSTDSGTVTRVVTIPSGGADGIYTFDGSAILPKIWTFGSGIVRSGSSLQIDYSGIIGKPTLSTVATTGDYTDLLNKPTIPGAQVNSDWNAVSGIAQILNKPTLGTAAAQNASAFMAANPGGTTAQYVRGDGTLATLPSPGTGTVTSVVAGTGLSGGTITSTGTVSMPNVGASGTYTRVTTDAQGRVTAGSLITTGTVYRTSATSPTAFQPSINQSTIAIYNVTLSNSVNIISLTSQFSQVDLQISSTGTSNWVTVGRARNATTVGLAIALSLTDTVDIQIQGVIPQGYWARLLRAGTGTITDLAGTETQI